MATQNNDDTTVQERLSMAAIATVPVAMPEAIRLLAPNVAKLIEARKLTAGHVDAFVGQNSQANYGKGLEQNLQQGPKLGL